MSDDSQTELLRRIDVRNKKPASYLSMFDHSDGTKAMLTSQGLGTKPPLATTVAAMCSNWENKLGESAEML